MSQISPSPSETSDATTRRPAPTPRDATSIAPGTEVAHRYWVIESVGSGAMGRVYRAYDSRLGREVALKRLRFQGRSADADAEARLAREARAMAQLNHVNVVGVYDVVSDATGMTLAMEYVRGTTLRQWLTQTRTPDEILDAFEQAGRGLAAAHAAGFVHRDFKPANVMVAQDGCVKVTDFGVARSTRTSASSDDDGGMFVGPRAENLTQLGTVIGTPRYMSPEQHHAGQVDEKSDQYSFCLALWEALVGTSPFSASTTTSFVSVKEAGPPAWPRTVAVPAAIAQTIVRGLSPDPAHRWPSMSALLATVAAARRPRARVRWLLGLGVAAAATAGVTWAGTHSSACHAPPSIDGWDQAAHAAVVTAVQRSGLGFAEKTATRVAQQLHDYATAWAEASHDNCIATRVTGQQSETMMDRSTLCLARSQSHFVAAVEVVHREAAESKIDRLIEVVNQLPPPARCRDPEWLSGAVSPPIEAQVQAVQRLQQELARVDATIAAGRADLALTWLRELQPRALATEYEPLIAAASFSTGQAHRAAGRSVEAIDPLRESYTRALSAGDDRGAAAAARQLGLVLGYDLSDPTEGLLLVDTALALQRRPGADPTEGLLARMARGLVLPRLGRQTEALDDLRAAYDAAEAMVSRDSPVWTRVATAFGVGLFEAGHNEDAAALHRAVLQVEITTGGENHPATVLPRINIAAALEGIGELQEALRLLEQAKTIVTDAFGPVHPRAADCDLNLSAVYTDLGDHENALLAADAALAGYRALLGDTHSRVARAHAVRARALVESGRYDQAEQAYATAIALDDATAGKVTATALSYRLRAAHAMLLQGRAAQAAAAVRDTMRDMAQVLPSDHADFGLAWELLGEALLALGQPAAAIDSLRQALAIVEASQHRPGAPAIVRFKLAKALYEGGEQAHARTAARAARDALAVARGNYEADRRLLDEIDAWLTSTAGERVLGNP